MSRVHLPSEGDRFTVRTLTGYVMVQDRPMDCKGWRPSKIHPGQYTGACECGKCDGVTTEHPGTVERVIYWADNSIDVEIRGDDDGLYTQQMAAPSGDCCF